MFPWWSHQYQETPHLCLCIAPFLLISPTAFGIFLNNLDTAKSILYSNENDFLLKDIIFNLCNFRIFSAISLIESLSSMRLICNSLLHLFKCESPQSLKTPSNILQKLCAYLHYSELSHWLERNIIHSKWYGRYSCSLSCHVCSHSRHWKAGEGIWEKAGVEKAICNWAIGAGNILHLLNIYQCRCLALVQFDHRF